MLNLTVQQIRDTFTGYFSRNEHELVPSSSLVPHNDPSLMFVNSGMVQFKDVFTGNEKRNYTKATTAQKCVRAGGKHNDLDNVGYTARHHTFFEMLGNFSFGDYFKEEAIYHAWSLLTGHLQLPKEKLYVTVYHNDEEAAGYWKKIAGFSDERIIRINSNDNFWSMGETGPCGPCTEIFYDHGSHIAGGLPGTPEQDGDRFIEIWNLVFMQYEQVNKDNRILLPNKSVDTGMGLERISAIIQGVHDNYDIDIFRNIIAYAESIIKKSAKGEALFSYRIIADHLRSSAFLIADGVMPSNEGRGYVLRRILRRAMRHAHQLGAKEAVMYKLFPRLVDLFGNNYSELYRAEEFVTGILKQEEERFKTTLDRGLKLLEEESASITEGGRLPGEVAFKLYDTYGFPLDLTQDILKKQNISVDINSFKNQMQLQKERARKAWIGSGESKTDSIWFDIMSEVGATEFLGYSLECSEGKILGIIRNGKMVEQIESAGDKFILVVNQTPFYGESGGQMGDIGFIESVHSKIEVTNTLKFLGKIIGHVCELKQGSVKANDEVSLAINKEYRNSLRKHHTATHILHAVLREVLGKHVTQKGSLVAEDKLRFDFSHSAAVTSEEIKMIESMTNNIISNNSQVLTELMSADQAIEAGAMALFGEKYDNEVRVVSLGSGSKEREPYSFELCGGTHVSRTGDIGAFKIISENAVAAGIRRIEAVCGKFAFEEIARNENILLKIIDMVKSNKVEVLDKVKSLVEGKKDLEKEIELIRLNSLMYSKSSLNSAVQQIEGARLLYKEITENINLKVIRIAVENMIKTNEDLLLLYIVKCGEKISVIIGASRNISAEYNAGKIGKIIESTIGGNGGGHATLAQVGGIDASKLAEIKPIVINLKQK